MSEKMEKYVAKALEGYEANHKAVSEAINQMEIQLVEFKKQREEMTEGITEMKKILGLKDEDALGGNAKPVDLKIVNDGAPVDME
jgi:hypothetical protein